MATAHDNFEKGLGLSNGDAESAGSDGKVTNQHIDDAGKDGVQPGLSPTRVFQPPELVRNMTPEQRILAEKKLRQKIDLRLMPMIVLMYIMNYLDRACLPNSNNMRRN